MVILLQGFTLGLLGGLVPGAILTILFVSVLQGGVNQGLRAFGWSLAAELLVAGSLVYAIMLWSPDPVWFHYLGIVGSIVLLYFAWGIWQIKTVDTDVDSKKIYSPIEILTLAATNAPLYVFWVTICIPLIYQLFDQFSVFTAATLYLSAFEIGWALSTLGMMFVFVFARPYLVNDRIASRTYQVIAIIMALFAGNMLYKSISLLGLI